MDLKKTMMWSGISGVLLFLPIAFYFSFQEGLSFALGGIWGAANLWLIKNLVSSLLSPAPKDPLKVIFLLVLKFPLLYGAITALFFTHLVPLHGFMMGFSLVLAILVTLSLGCAIGKKTMTALLLLASSPLMATLENEAPELPNVITLIYKSFSEAPQWALTLHHWQNIIFSIGIACLISLIFYLCARKSALIPKKFQNALEFFIEGFRDFVVGILGKEGEKYVPFLGTLFIYILVMNWFVLIPLMKSPSASINVTAGLAITVFVLVQYLNIRNWGIRGFLFHLAGSPKDGVGWAMVPLMLPIEILTQLTRPLTLALRLFGNVLGEDILIGVFALFGVGIFASFQAPIGIPLQIPFMFLALLTGLMQAGVFTLLSTVYILLSQPDHNVE
jgi:F-type H+-transporting ATPase subunit a